MVDLRAKPYCLNDADIAWVESTIASMTDDYLVELYTHLFGNDTLAATYHGYFD